MAKVQTRRTVSLSRRLKDSLEDYANRHGIAMSAFTEFVLESAIGLPLDAAGFDAWFAKRAHIVAAAQLSAAKQSWDGQARQRRAESLAARAARDERRAARTKLKQSRRAAIAARLEAREKSGSVVLCTACDDSGHNRSTCPRVYGPKKPPRRTRSVSDQAVAYRARYGGSLEDVAARFGITRQAVQQREDLLRKAGVL